MVYLCQRQTTGTFWDTLGMVRGDVGCTGDLATIVVGPAVGVRRLSSHNALRGAGIKTTSKT